MSMSSGPTVNKLRGWVAGFCLCYCSQYSSVTQKTWIKITYFLLFWVQKCLFWLVTPSCDFSVAKNVLQHSHTAHPFAKHTKGISRADPLSHIIQETGSAGYHYLTVILLPDLVTLKYSFCNSQIFKAGDNLVCHTAFTHNAHEAQKGSHTRALSWLSVASETKNGPWPMGQFIQTQHPCFLCK